MKDKIRIGKYFINLIRYHFKASRALKKDDEQKHHLILQKLSNSINKSINKYEVEVINKEVLKDIDGSILLANHQDNLDIFLLLSAIDKPIRFVAKKELAKIPLFQNYMKLSHSYLLDRNDARQGLSVLKNVVKDVNENNKHVVIFPEGTRSKASLMSSFNSGLFNIIRKANRPIIPIYINNSYSNNKITIIFGKPIKQVEYKDLKANELKEKVYQEMVQLKKDKIKDIKEYRILGMGDSITFGELYNQTYDKGYYYRFIEQLKDEGMLKKEYNLAIPGSSISDVAKLIDDDNYERRLKNVVYDDIDKDYLYHLLKQKDKTIKDIIKESDLLLFTCGANDVLEVVSNYQIKKDQQIIKFKEMRDNLAQLFKKFKHINPSIKIVFFGQYFPYPHIKPLLKYNYIDILDGYLKELSNNKDIFYISLNTKVLENKDSFLPKRKNIHLSKEGYLYMNNELVKLFQSKVEHKL